MNKSIEIEKTKRKELLNGYYQKELDNVKNIIQKKDTIDLQKQIGQQKKLNKINSQIISTKLNKICTIQNNQNINGLKDHESQIKQEIVYSNKLKNHEEKNYWQRWASVEKDRVHKEYQKYKEEFKIKYEKVKLRQKLEIESVQNMIAMHKKDEDNFQALARS